MSGAVDGLGDYVVTVQGDSGVQQLTATSAATSVTFASVGGEAMTAGNGCSGTGPVTCAFDPVDDFVDVLLGGGGDSFDGSAVGHDLGLSVDGGDGDDSITGTPFADFLIGGAGDDKLVPGGGADEADAGDGDDLVDLRDGGQDSALATCGGGSSDLLQLDPSETGGAACEYVAPRFTAPPTIVGDPVMGNTLTVAPGAVTGGPGIAHSNQWVVCGTPTVDTTCTPVLGPTGPSQRIHLAGLFVRPGSYVGVIHSARLLTPAGIRSISLRAGFAASTAAAYSASVRVVAPSNVFTFGSFRSGTTGSLTVNVPGAGTLTAGPVSSGSAAAKKKKKKKAKALVGRSSASPIAAGAVKLPIKLTSEGRKQLKKKGRLKVKLRVSFEPNGGTIASKTASVTFKAKKPKKKKRR